MNERNNINVFISSKNRDSNSTPYNYTCKLPDDLIRCNQSQGIKINIISFDMVNSMYNINSHNNHFQLITTDLIGGSQLIYNYYIPDGNYSVVDLKNWINSNNNFMIITYNTITNKYTFVKSNNSIKLYLNVINSGAFLGFDNGSTIEIISNISMNKLNIVYSNKIIIRALNLNFEIESLENINNTDDKFELSNILLWVSKNDIAPFQVISYNNYDGGNSYSYNLYNKSIDTIHFLITNEFNEVITDLPDWTMSCQFSIYERKDDEMTRLIAISNNYLREIYVFLHIFYSWITGS